MKNLITEKTRNLIELVRLARKAATEAENALHRAQSNAETARKLLEALEAEQNAAISADLEKAPTID